LSLGLLLLNQAINLDLNRPQPFSLIADYFLELAYFFLYEVNLSSVKIGSLFGCSLYKEACSILNEINLLILTKDKSTPLRLLR
jgi:hypothetical protein